VAGASEPEGELQVANASIEALTPEQLYPGVRPELASLLTEMYLQERELWAEVERATAEFNRPRGIMGKLFGLRTSVG
jgi:hypothetical protein